MKKMYKIFVCLCLLGGWRAVMQNITKFCPSHKGPWQERKRQYGCSPQSHFHCMQNDQNQLVEFCMGEKGLDKGIYSHFHIFHVSKFWNLCANTLSKTETLTVLNFIFFSFKHGTHFLLCSTYEEPTKI